MKRVVLSDIASVFNGKTPSNAEKKEVGHPVLKIKNINSYGKFIGFDSYVDDAFFEKHRNKRILSGDTLFLNAAHNSDYVGSKIFFAEQDVNEVLATGEWLIIRPDRTQVDEKFLHYFVSSGVGLQEIKSLVKGIHLYPKDVARIPVPLPPLELQKRIAETLDKADAMRQRNRQILQKYAQIAQSLFLEMFQAGIVGNHFNNKVLHEIADVVSGVTKNTKDVRQEMVEVPYMRVANVQDGRLDLSEVKTIKVKPNDFKKYQLEYEDILLTEGGDPDKLGRGYVWHSEIDNCIHQNHIFRVRLNKEVALPLYVAHLISSKFGKVYFLKAAKQTTGIATINSTQLKRFKVPLPDISMQKKFVEIVERFNSGRKEIELEAKKSDDLFQSLLQKAFNGELFD